MIYSELAFFEGGHFAHIADYQERRRLRHLRRRMVETAIAQTRRGRAPDKSRVMAAVGQATVRMVR